MAFTAEIDSSVLNCMPDSLLQSDKYHKYEKKKKMVKLYYLYLISLVNECITLSWSILGFFSQVPIVF